MKLLSHFLLFAAVCSSPLQAVTVTTLIDEDDGDLIAGSGAANGISLREAINHTTSGDTVTFDPTLSGSTITLSSGQLLIDQDLTIDASALADGITIDANGPVTNHRVLEITPGNTVSLDSLTLTNGVASGSFPAYHGGAIYNDQATLSLTACTIYGNSAYRDGGAIYSVASSEANAALSLTACTLSGNFTSPDGSGSGGGIFSSSRDGSASLKLIACTLSGNSARLSGGAIESSSSRGDGSVSLTLIACTLSGNSADIFYGGAITSKGDWGGQASLSLTSCTFYDNSAHIGGAIYSRAHDEGNAALSLTACTLSGNSATDGGGIYSDTLLDGTASVSLENTILAGNTADSYPDLYDSSAEGTTLLGKNLMSESNGLTDDALIVVPDPMLRTLGDYGGPTQTMPPLRGSPAIDMATVDPLITSDQRGAPRPYDGDEVAGALPDIGAIEFHPNIVNNNNDSGEGSLRDAIHQVIVGDTIIFDSALSGSTITLESGQLLIDKDLTIDASALADGITIDANGPVTNHRVLEITPGNTVSLDSLTLTNGVASGDSPANFGGAIYNDHATLSLTACTLSGNSATDGGGVYNVASSEGNAALSLTTCTLSGNSATDGGGIYSGANSEGNATLSLKNTILAGNSATSYPDLHDSSAEGTTLLGKNLMSDSNGLTGDALIVVPDPMLRPLGDYGGPTQTMLPLRGSPAIDMATVDPLITSDQRGAPRSFDGDEIAGALPDIGAIEFYPKFVTNNNDSGVGSLRDAINQVIAGDTIIFESALSRSTITLESGQLLIDKDLTIDASALADGITIDANGSVTNHRVLEITPQNTVTLHSLRLTNGVTSGVTAADYGGAIYNNQATLSLTACTLSGNSVNRVRGSRGGGAIYSYASSEGNASLSLTACTLYGNSANSGGAISSDASSEGNATLSLTACTLYGNSAFSGGAIYSNGSSFGDELGHSSLSLTACTLSGNYATSSGGGIYSYDSNDVTLSLKNTILAGNTATSSPDLSGSVTSLLGMNLMSDSNGRVDDALIVVLDPMLSPLGDYGGPTQTRPPLPGSPAIEGALLLEGSPLTDQRGAPRPSGLFPDIGAVEAFPFSTLALDDTDSDDIPDLLEGPDGPYPHLVVGIDDSTLDTDGDGSLDKDEIGNMTNPLDANDYFRILSVTPASDFDAQSNPVLEITVKTFPGLEYEFECNQDLDFSGTPDTIDLGTADQFTETLEVQLAPGQDFIRAVRK